MRRKKKKKKTKNENNSNNKNRSFEYQWCCAWALDQWKQFCVLVLVSRGCSGGPCEQSSEAVPCQTRGSSSCSKRDLLLARVEPSAIVVPLWEQERKVVAQQWLGEKNNICERNSPVVTKVSTEREQKMFQIQSRSSLQAVEGPVVKLAVHLQCMDTIQNRFPCAAHGGAQSAAGRCGPKQAAAHGETLEMQDPGWSCSLWRGACGRVDGLGELLSMVTITGEIYSWRMTPWRAAAYGKPIQDQFRKDGILWEGPHAGAGSEDNHEGVAEIKC